VISDLAVRTFSALPEEPFLRTRCAQSGISRSGIEELVAAGMVRQPLRGVLVRADAPDTIEVRAAAARLVLPPGAALCRITSAWLYGIDARPPGAHTTLPSLECMVDPGREPLSRPGLRCFISDLTSDDVVHVLGLPCTSPDRTAIDLARWLSPGMGLGVLDAMARARLIDPAELVFHVERWRGDRYVARARRLIRLCDPRAESFGESWLRLRFHDAGFPPPEPQIVLRDHAGRQVYRLDLGYPVLRSAWEYDGEPFHRGHTAEAADRRRREEIRHRWGWTVYGVEKNLVLGPSMALERGIAEVTGILPRIGRRPW
jgi:hypothetical protein